MKKLICIFAFAAVLAGCRKPVPEPDPVPVLDDFNVAEALYYGDYYDNGCDNYFVRLVRETLDLAPEIKEAIRFFVGKLS